MTFFAWAEARKKSRSLTLDAFLARFRSLSLSLPGLDRAIITVERQKEVICTLSHGDISNDLDGPLTRFSRSRHFWNRISKKNGCILGTLFYRTLTGNHTQSMVPLSMTLSDLWPGFQGHDILWSRISEKRHVLKTKLLLHNRQIIYGMVLWLLTLTDL